MFFERRRWAIRVTERTGLSVSSREGSYLIETLIWASKRSIDSRLTVRQSVLASAFLMVDTPGAIDDFCRKADIDRCAAALRLLNIRSAAEGLSLQFGEINLLQALRKPHAPST